jgi:hypothetical protein
VKTSVATLIKQIQEADFLNDVLKEQSLNILNYGNSSQITEFANKFLSLKKLKEALSKKRNIGLAGLALFFSRINAKKIAFAKKEMFKRVESTTSKKEEAQFNSLLKYLYEI